MMKTMGLYVHIPFCKKKCLYCDFPSFGSMEEKYEEYVSALEREVEKRGQYYKSCQISSIFFGGGTPTVLSKEQLARLMLKIKKSFFLAKDAEITIEANPGTIEKEKAEVLKKIGFNRLSMGVQAWQNRLLSTLGRIHTIEEFQNNFQVVRKAGFDNINVDLMFALPTQTFGDWKETLDKITSMNPEHISAYSLIIEEGTPFYEAFQKGELLEIGEELDREMYHYAVSFLEKRGYGQYEISNFAKAGRESRHNEIYWQTEPYLGVGLGAHSYLNGNRFHNTYDLDKYILAEGEISLLEEEKEVVTKEDAMGEFMFLGLRMTEGVSYESFFSRFGVEMTSVYGAVIYDFVESGLMMQTENGVALTARGIDLSNQVFAKFLLD
ncbi:radical SAM family heme chaperone HemW [Anaerotignum sp.]|uniref:radical SAM family heme chaperone HemW n=1 Tax=Anaerotignum sp. TaxID=2039241 RepID=UPI0027146B24|nr:radical SAM family heme chaperone HemW [Anaerotignum sp.]